MIRYRDRGLLYFYHALRNTQSPLECYYSQLRSMDYNARISGANIGEKQAAVSLIASLKNSTSALVPTAKSNYRLENFTALEEEKFTMITITTESTIANTIIANNLSNTSSDSISWLDAIKLKINLTPRLPLDESDLEKAITNAITMIETRILSSTTSLRAAADEEIKTALETKTKAQADIIAATTVAQKTNAESKLAKASNINHTSTMMKTINQERPILMSFLDDKFLVQKIFQGCNNDASHADAAALVIVCFNVVLTVRSDQADNSDGYIPTDFSDITDMQLRSVIMVGGWAIREARMMLFTLYKNDPKLKSILYEIIGNIMMPFDKNIVMPAEEDDSDSVVEVNTDVSDHIPLFLKHYNEGGLTIPTKEIRVVVFSHFQFTDECFRRLSKSSRQPQNIEQELVERLVDDVYINCIRGNESKCLCASTIEIIRKIALIMVSKLTNCRNGMLLRHFVGNQNILASDKVHIRQKLAAYSIVGNNNKQASNTVVMNTEDGDAAGIEDEFSDDNLQLQGFEVFNEAEEFYLKDILQNIEEDQDTTRRLEYIL